MIEDIKDRIQKIIDSEELTSSKFAEMIGVQRATISHVLNGRNLPSLDLVRKILITFSTLNSEWLIFGRGAMHKSSKNAATLFESDSETIENETVKDKSKQIDNSQKSDADKNISEIKYNSDESNSEKLTKQNLPEETTNYPISISKNEVEKIIILNSDKTFTEYTKSQ